jgi:hypothetical protein
VDFTGDVVGKFVYHCHVLYHEDHGMMAVVQVVPCPEGATYCRDVSASSGSDSEGEGGDKHTMLIIAVGVLAGLVGLLIIAGVVGVAYCFDTSSAKFSSLPLGPLNAQPSQQNKPNPAADGTAPTKVVELTGGGEEGKENEASELSEV